METAPDPLPAALREADRFGWLLYADKIALGEGKWAEVAKRVQERARRGKMGLLGAVSIYASLILPNLVFTLTDRTHGVLGPVVGVVGLGMTLAYGAFLVPYLWRTYSRIASELRRLA